MKHSQDRTILVLPGGERMAYFEAGSGPDLVLIHGAFVTSHDMLLSLVEPFAAAGFHVVAFDRPGHGLSTRRRFEASPQRQAAQILEAAQSLELNRPSVVGHSFGATVAVEMALAAPDEIAALIAIAPMAFPEFRLEQFIYGPRGAPGLGDLAATIGDAGPDAALLRLLWSAMFLPQSMPEAFRDGMAFHEVSSGRGLLANGEDALATAPALAFNLPRYRACEVPVEVIYGQNDIVINPRVHAAPLSRLLPNATLTRLRGLGHMIHHFEQELIVGKTLALSAARRSLEPNARRRDRSKATAFHP